MRFMRLGLESTAAFPAFLALILFLGPAAGFAQSAPAETNQSPPERQLQLQVLDAASNQPVSGVRVRAWVRGELQTDVQGRCAFALPPPHLGSFRYRIVLDKPGFVPEAVTWSTAQQDTIEGMPTNYTAHLTKAVGIGGIVKNAKGEPIPDARVIFSGPISGGVDHERSLVSPNYHAEKTDADGRWTNNEVPPDFSSFTFHVVQPEYVSANFGCAASDDDTNLIVISTNDFLAGNAVMTLGHGIVVSGRIVNPSGQPVAGAVITKDYEWRNPATTQETGADGRFEMLNLRPGEMILIVQSPDWAPRTVPVTLTNGLPELTIALHPGTLLRGRILDVSGQPVPGARIELDRVGRDPLEFDWSADADSDGSFAWSNAPEGEYPYIAAAPGFHARSIPAWAAGGPEKLITLRPEKDGDGVETGGQITDAATGAPVSRFVVHLTEVRNGATISSDQPFDDSKGQYRLKIDPADSAFAVAIQAAGYLPVEGARQDPGDGDQSVDFALERGVAREVTGRFVVNNYNGWIDWPNQDITLGGGDPKPAGLDSDDPETANRLMRDFLHTPAGRKWLQAQRPQAVDVDSRGFFKFEGVAPGAHELRIQVGAGGRPVAGLTKKIEVPEASSSSNGPVDLGAVALTARHELADGEPAPDFDVKSLDGPNLKLSAFKGRYVLLDFWATWCGPCVGEVPNLKAAYNAFGQDPRLVMISLSLDADPSAPKNFARKNGVKWRQGFLGDWSRSDVPNQFGVDGIPAIFLIGPDGKILEHNLRGPAITDALKRALNVQN